MSLWFAVLMGLVQGLTEFLPISSSAHLRVLPALLGQADPGSAFTAVLQLGTLLAVCIYFARDLFVTIPRAALRSPGSAEGRLPWLIAVGTIPIVVAGVGLEPHIEGSLRSLYVIAGTLLGVGIVMAWIDARATGRRTALDLGWSDAVWIGAAQACALVPGVSRSGATICMALVVGMSRSEAARYSFLLGIPAIAGAGIFEARDAAALTGADGLPALVVGCVVAAISGYLSIAWLMRFLATRRLTVFAAYRAVLALVVLGLVLAGLVPADAR